MGTHLHAEFMQAPGASRDKHAGLQRLQGEIMLRQWGTLFCPSLSVAARGAGTGSDWSATAGVAGWGIDATTGRLGPHADFPLAAGNLPDFLATL